MSEGIPTDFIPTTRQAWLSADQRRGLHEACTERGLAHVSVGPRYLRKLLIAADTQRLASHPRPTVRLRAPRRPKTAAQRKRASSVREPHTSAGFASGGGSGALSPGKALERARRRKRASGAAGGGRGGAAAGGGTVSSWEWAKFKLVDARISVEEFLEQLQLPARTPEDWPEFKSSSRPYSHQPTPRDSRPTQVLTPPPLSLSLCLRVCRCLCLFWLISLLVLVFVQFCSCYSV